MNPTSIGIGCAALAFGFYTQYLRFANPAKLVKLGAMKKAYGDRMGGIIHFVSYTLIPICMGVGMIFAGWRGVKVL